MINIKLIKETLSKDFGEGKPFDYQVFSDIFQDNCKSQLYNLFPQNTESENSLIENNKKKHYRFSISQRDDFLRKNLDDLWNEFLRVLELDLIPFLNEKFNMTVSSYEWKTFSEGGWLGPHPDAPNKTATMLFYLNDETNWKESFGGNLFVLKAEKQLKPITYNSYEDFEIIDKVVVNKHDGFFFLRTDYSWHSVENIKYSQGFKRRNFSIIFKSI